MVTIDVPKNKADVSVTYPVRFAQVAISGDRIVALSDDGCLWMAEIDGEDVTWIEVPRPIKSAIW